MTFIRKPNGVSIVRFGISLKLCTRMFQSSLSEISITLSFSTGNAFMIIYGTHPSFDGVAGYIQVYFEAELFPC